jgi:LPS export ABC transporter protein LptC
MTGLRVRALLLGHWQESLLLLLLGPLALYFSLSNFTSESLPRLPLPETQVLQLEQITLRDYQKDFQRWTLTGLRASMAEDGSIMNVEQPRLRLHPSSETIPFTNTLVRANEALIDWRLQLVEIRGDVEVEREGKLYLQSERAVYDLETEVLRMPGAVQMTWQGSDVDGADLRYELKTGLVELRGVHYQR